jgi:hypothetical protein
LETSKVSAGHGYIESAPFVPASGGITMRENGSLSSWSNPNNKAVWFLYQQKGTYEVGADLRGTTGVTYNFEMKTSPAYDGLSYEDKSFAFSYTGTGSAGNPNFFTVVIPETGYYRYELNAKSSMTGLTMETLRFAGIRKPGESSSPDTHATDYLSSPSVHLSFSSTESPKREYDWLYEEILVPEGFDPTSSYYMSLGFFGGYMGIQVNSTTERRVLFSAWDIVDKDKWPDAPREALVTLVDKADYTTANGFGNEGTGGQSYVGKGNPNTWKTGTPVKFLMNCRRAGGIIAPETISGVVNRGDSIRHSVVSAWYDANDGNGWRYIASWRMPRKPSDRAMFDGFYSFLENFGWRNGQVKRKAYYYNAYAKETNNGKWVHLNKVGFSNTDGATGQRIDYEQGVSTDEGHTDKFYMLSGGYGQTNKGGNTLPLKTIENFPYLRDLDIAPFTERVNQALEKEYTLNNLQYIDKTGWEVIDFSSQETSEEPNGNGKANLIIDGDDATYWHSKWSEGSASYPHWFVVDMKKAETLKGFRIVPSGGQDRYPRNIAFEVSNDPNGTWTEVWSGDAILSPELITLGTEATNYRYFKFSIKSGTASDGSYVRIGEIFAF